jgi:hypothetical protein
MIGLLDGRIGWGIRMLLPVGKSSTLPEFLSIVLGAMLQRLRIFPSCPSTWKQLLTPFSYRYFIWDTLDAVFNFVDAGFVVHGVACTLIYSMSFVSHAPDSPFSIVRRYAIWAC